MSYEQAILPPPIDRAAGPWLSLQSSGCVENQKQRRVSQPISKHSELSDIKHPSMSDTARLISPAKSFFHRLKPDWRPNFAFGKGG